MLFNPCMTFCAFDEHKRRRFKDRLRWSFQYTILRKKILYWHLRFKNKNLQLLCNLSMPQKGLIVELRLPVIKMYFSLRKKKTVFLETFTKTFFLEPHFWNHYFNESRWWSHMIALWEKKIIECHNLTVGRHSLSLNVKEHLECYAINNPFSIHTEVRTSCGFRCGEYEDRFSGELPIACFPSVITTSQSQIQTQASIMVQKITKDGIWPNCCGKHIAVHQCLHKVI